MLAALGFAVVSNFFAYWFSDKMVLRMYNAQEVDETTAPQFYTMVRELAWGCRAADAPGLPDPGRGAQRVCHRPQSGACRGGRDHGHLACVGACELRGVMAHESAHVRSPTSTISGHHGRRRFGPGQLCDAVRRTRQRRPSGESDRRHPAGHPGALRRHAHPDGDLAGPEFEADRHGAQISGDPAALVLALDRVLHRYAQGIPLETTGRHPETARDDDDESAVGGRLARAVDQPGSGLPG